MLDFHQDADNPHWGMHKAVYDCPFSDDWKAWVGSDGNKMNQIDFAEFLENNIQNIAPISDNYKGPSGTDLLEMVLAFQETRKVEFKSVKRLQDGTCQFQYSDDKSGSGNTKIPEKSVWLSRLSIMAHRTKSMRAFATACATVSWSSGMS